MAIRLIALDLDDTLLTPQPDHQPADRADAAAGDGPGVQVVIATMLPSALPYARQLGLTTPVILCQGAVRSPIRSPAHPAAYAGARGPGQGHPGRAAEDGRLLPVYQGEDYYFSKFGVHSELYRVLARHAGKEVGYPLSDAVTMPPDKLLLIDEPERLPGIKAHLAEEPVRDMTLAESKPYYLEINHAQANKGRCAALRGRVPGGGPAGGHGHRRQHQRHPHDPLGGLGGCMGSGRQAAKDAADFVTEDNAHDGVACAVRRYLWGRRAKW